MNCIITARALSLALLSVIPTSTSAQTMRFDGLDLTPLREAHASGAPFELVGVPVDDRGQVELLLEPFYVIPRGGYATVVEPDGSTTRMEPTIRMFRGVVIGDGGSAFLAVDESGIVGRVQVGGVEHRLSSGDHTAARQNQTRLATTGAISETSPAWCLTPSPTHTGASPSVPRASGPRDHYVGLEVRVHDVFYDVEPKFVRYFPTTIDAINYVVLLAGATSEIFRRDVGVVLRVPSGYLRIWKTTPPWRLTSFYEWWQTNDNPASRLPRAAVVRISKGPAFGQAPVASVCDNTRSYSWASLGGRGVFPFKHTSKDNRDLQINTHELGHVFGSHHTNTIQYRPPILCNDGSGPDGGTVMSYCGFGPPSTGFKPSYEVWGMRFHARVQDLIRSYVSTISCAEVIPIRRGDYDANGRLDAFDLAELDAYLVQGFESRGSEETFDMNRNGVVDLEDRRILAIDAHVPEAYSTRRFPPRAGASNCDCLFSDSRPILGATWVARVAAEDDARTIVVGSTMALERGIATDFGDLLVGLTRHGATELFVSQSTAIGHEAIHSIALPLDPALVGLRVSTQAAIITRNAWKLSNAIDLLLSLN